MTCFYNKIIIFGSCRKQTPWRFRYSISNLNVIVQEIFSDTIKQVILWELIYCRHCTYFQRSLKTYAIFVCAVFTEFWSAPLFVRSSRWPFCSDGWHKTSHSLVRMRSRWSNNYTRAPTDVMSTSAKGRIKRATPCYILYKIRELHVKI